MGSRKRVSQVSAREAEPEFSRISRQPRLFGRATGFVISIFVVVLAAAIIVPNAPEYQKMLKIERELADTHYEENRLLKKRRQFELESQALNENLDYLEHRARDMGPFYRKGESIIKIEE